jgi:hypothetical protein
MNENAVAAITADLLAQGRRVHEASSALNAGALIALLLSPWMDTGATVAATAAAVLIIGLVETWMAARVGFDAALLRRFGCGAPSGRLDLATFDRTMTSLALMPSAKTGRPLSERAAGARRLLAIQAGALAIQVAAALAGTVLGSLAR